jgi:hypothetical protein
MSRETRSFDQGRNTPPGQSPARSAPDSSEREIRVDGMGQVIEMLRSADPAFRASLIRRLQARDPDLARKLLRLIR